jgi:antitoxin component of RelBE/YafQ-DinJ toxin-antitoxin module
MRKKERTNISLDIGLKKEAEEVLKEVGVKLSTYINITLKTLVNSQKKTFQ